MRSDVTRGESRSHGGVGWRCMCEGGTGHWGNNAAAALPFCLCILLSVSQSFFPLHAPPLLYHHIYICTYFFFLHYNTSVSIILSVGLPDCHNVAQPVLRTGDCRSGVQREDVSNTLRIEHSTADEERLRLILARILFYRNGFCCW